MGRNNHLPDRGFECVKLPILKRFSVSLSEFLFINIFYFDMNLSALKDILKDQPRFRYEQVERAIYHDLIEGWQEATNLPAALRESLEEGCPLTIEAEISASRGSEKALITLADGLQIETVLMKHQDDPSSAKATAGKRNTICVSSQVGCPMGCLFCATGSLGFKRNLTIDEIVEQVLFFARKLKKEGRKVTNVVFMGMGEPFLNYDNVIGAIKKMNDPKGMNLGARRFSISTAGVTPGIRRLAKEGIEVNLALSLHSADSALRSRLMPINQNYPLNQVLKAIADYIDRTHRRVMFEYVMIKDVTDTPDQARQLIATLKGVLGFVNLIPYNATAGFKASTPERIRKFKDILVNSAIPVVQRHGFGQDIDAACGQLAGKNKKAR